MLRLLIALDPILSTDHYRTMGVQEKVGRHTDRLELRMSPDHQLSERVYNALKRELLSGDIRELRLAVARLGARYHTSATPVREALLRLVGEGVVDINPAGGFSLSQLTQRQMLDLYDLNMRVILSAAAGVGMNDCGPAAIPEAHSATVIEDLLLDIAGATLNQALVTLVESLNDRMRRIRHAEKDEITNIENEIRIMARQFRHGERTKLRRSLIAYHRRRMRRCQAIWARLLTYNDAIPE